jgi:hypothetical protein
MVNMTRVDARTKIIREINKLIKIIKRINTLHLRLNMIISLTRSGVGTVKLTEI